MMTWTLWLLLHTATGEYVALEGRTYTNGKRCWEVADGVMGRPVSNAVIYKAMCKEKIDV
jgi:hypothetical protein